MEKVEKNKGSLPISLDTEKGNDIGGLWQQSDIESNK